MSSLLQVFFSPKELFVRLEEKPNWVLPFVTVIVVTLAVTIVLLPTVIRPFTLEKMESRFEGSDEQLQKMRDIVAGPVLYGTSIASAVFGTGAKMLIIAGIYTLITLPLPGERRYRKLLSVTSYSALISVLGGIVGAAIMVARKSLEVSLSLNLFFPFVEKDTFLFRLLKQANFFTIWSLLVFALGLSIICKMNIKKSYVLVFALWIVALLVGAALGGLGARFSRFS